MKKVALQELIDRADANRDLANQFLRWMAACSFLRIEPEPLVPRNDPTLILTNSAVVPFKPYLRGELTIPASGIVVLQPCVRFHSLDDTHEEATSREFGLDFEMMGALVGSDGAETIAKHIFGWLVDELRVPAMDVLFRVHRDDEDLSAAGGQIRRLTDSAKECASRQADQDEHRPHHHGMNQADTPNRAAFALASGTARLGRHNGYPDQHADANQEKHHDERAGEAIIGKLDRVDVPQHGDVDDDQQQTTQP